MKLRIVAVVIALVLALPYTSHAFGVTRYFFDMVANQLGLDRGPIPKVPPQNPPPDVAMKRGGMVPQHPESKKIYIQAEGF